MAITLTVTARGLRIVPGNAADEAQLAAIGWAEGGDWMHLVRIDVPNSSQMRFLQVVRDPAQLDRTQFQLPKPHSVYEAENPNGGLIASKPIGP